MKKFHFSLERLLKIRHQRVKTLKGALLQEREEWEQLKKKERALLCELFSQGEEMSKERHQGNFQKQRAFDHYIGLLQEEVTTVQKALAAKEECVRSKQHAVTQAIQRRKIVEKLREKQYSQWQAESNKEESTALDEIATQTASPH